MNSNFAFLFDNPYDLHYTFDANGNAWFYAHEIAKYLGYPRADHMVRPCDPNDIIHMTINNPVMPEIGLDMNDTIHLACPQYGQATHGGVRQFIAVKENGLYDIILASRSERPEIERFRHWVKNVLLPAVKRHDAYIGPEAAARIQADPTYINEIIAENEALKHRLALQPIYHLINKNQYPYCDYEQMKKYQELNQELINVGKSVCQHGENVSIDMMAKILSQSMTSLLGPVQFRSFLRDFHLLTKSQTDQNKPTQLAITRGYMVYEYEDNGKYRVMITPEGMKYITKLAIDNGYAD